MEAFANGGQQSERLWQELMSYQLGRIDDTWVEAVHRDITGVAKRGKATKVPFLGAMVWRSQTLREVELMTEAELDFFTQGSGELEGHCPVIGSALWPTGGTSAGPMA